MAYEWTCEATCRFGDNAYTRDASEKLESIYKRLVASTPSDISDLVDEMKICKVQSTVERKGHDASCYEVSDPEASFKNISGCNSFMLHLKRLQSHFPRLRTLTRYLYQMMESYTNALVLGRILEKASDVQYAQYLTYLQSGAISKYIGEEIQLNRPSLNETFIMERYGKAIEQFHKTNRNLPRLCCISCKGLHKRSQCVDLALVHSKFRTNDMYKRVMNECDITEGNIMKSKYFACNTCHRKLCANTLPPLCTLNGMGVTETDPLIENLNDWEKLWVKRVHTFQTIVIPGTVAGRRMPSNQKHRKARGIILHLPIPIEETFHHVLQDEEVIRTKNLNIAVRTGLSENKKVVWQDIINIESVFESLKLFKYTYKHPAYQNIPLPQTLEAFRDYLQNNVLEISHIDENNEEIQIQLSTDSDVSVDVNCPATTRASDSIVTKLTLEGVEAYKNCTVMPINNRRKPGEESNFYRLEKVNAEPIKTWEHSDLDIKAFPDLYPDGKFGENYEREVLVSKSDFAKSRLRNKHHKYRQSIPYLFYLNNLKVLCELSSGIYTVMNVHKNKPGFTARDVLNKVEKGQLDKDLSTVFSNVRGTEENLRKPRQNLKTMLRHYGPATWFLTFSPTEWNWPDLAEYLREVNPNFTDQMNISQMTAKDPVSTAIYINNRFEAFVKFLLSDDHPLGKVTHYFFRREYQSRGIPHFHCLLWVKNSPQIGINPEKNYSRLYPALCNL